MRINLSFKDAQITQISESEFKIVFDLQNMNKPRLSPDARMYIEHFNLCEFRDEAYGEKGNLRGYFELRSQNIQNSDWNSEDGSIGNCVLYRSPLSSYNTFTNNDPMYISNFKINQGFLSNNFTMFLKFFDQTGDPYTTSNSFFTELDENSVEFTAHTVAIKALDDLYKEKGPVVQQIEDKTKKLKLQDSQVSNANNKLQASHKILIDAIDKFINKSNAVAIRSIIRLEVLKLLIKTYTVNDTIYTFETINYTLSGFASVATQLKAYYQVFAEYLEEIHIQKQLNFDIGNLKNGSDHIFEEFSTEFYPPSTLVKSDSKTSVAYTVTVASGIDKTGTLDIQYFNSPSATIAKKQIVVKNIKQTAQTLNKNDVLEIDSSVFDSIIPEIFTYKFVKDADTLITNVSFKNSSGVAFSEDRKKAVRFSLEVERDASDYTVKFTNLIENQNDGFSEGFEDGDQIIILGKALDGIDGINDLTITIPDVQDYATSVTLNFPTLNDGDATKGTVDIDIEVDNSAVNDYLYAINDLTNTQNFKVGDEFKIKGSDLNAGVDGLLAEGGNDAIFRVDDVIEESVEYSINDGNSLHSIPLTTINNSNSSITQGDGNPIPSSRTPISSDYTMEVSSKNGTYEITFASLIDASSGFENDDLIIIDGATLSGKSVENDLKIQVQADPSSGKITTAIVNPSDTYKARKATGYEFNTYVKNNVSTYEGKNSADIDVLKIGDDLQLNDTIKIEGTELDGIKGGATVGNDLVILIASVAVSPPLLLGTTHTGTPNNPTGNNGEIVLLTFKEGKNRFYDDIGEIVTTSVTDIGTVVDISLIPKPNGKITISSDGFEKSRDKINGEIASELATVKITKNALVPVNKKYITNITDYQKDKIKAMHLSMVLYDEIPEYSQSSYDAISGNTYSRVMNCQFKRI